MKKKGLLVRSGSICLILVLVALSFVTGCAKPAAPEVIELRYNTANPETHLLEANVLKPIWDEIEQRTEGRVKVTPYYSATLTSMAEIYDSILTGRADINHIYTAAAAGTLPVSEVICFAPLNAMTDKPSVIFWELYQKFPALQAEYSHVKVLSTLSSPQQNIVSKNEPVLTLEELQGFKMCSAGGWVAKRAEALGCSSFNVPIVDLYDAADKGLMDGTLFGWGDYFMFRMNEVSPVVTEVNFGYTPFIFAMSLDAWNKILPEDQRVIDELCGRNVAEKIDAAWWDHMTKGGVAQALQTGEVQAFQVPEEELARWSAAEQRVRDEWTAEMEAKGVSAGEILDEFDRLLEKYSVK